MRFLLPFLLFAPSPAAAERVLGGPIPAQVERVIDGDTFEARVAVWIDQEVVVSVRLAEVDAPELSRAECPSEKERALKAKAFTAAFLGTRAVLTDVRHDKYAGRVLAHVANAAGADLGEALVAAGLAERTVNAGWCEVS
jgi:micrococcal nuclease